MSEHPEKILGLEALEAALGRHRERGDRIVQCHGCFDIVHPGHIRYLRFAKSLGDKLLVTVSADEVVAKGAERPYIPEALRMENLAALEFVDYVSLSTDEWAGPLLERLRPDVYVKGREYETSNDPRFAREREVVESYGGQIVFGSGDVVFSSTEILRRHGGRFGLEPAKVRAFCHSHGIDTAAMNTLLASMRGRSVLVVGDPILDNYVHCEEANAAAEGPMLDVTPVTEEWYAGGAGLVARQLTALGARVRFITVGTPGPELDRLGRRLERAGVELDCLPTEARPVFVKTRYLVGAQKLFKVNRGVQAPVPASTTAELRQRIEQGLREFDALVATDFGYGLFGEALCAGITDACSAAGRPYYADVSTNGRANLFKFERPRLVTPTEKELRFALADAESGLANLAARYYRRSNAEHLIVTLGRRGALYFYPPQPDTKRLRTAYLPALETEALDSVGAGDVFLATTMLADLAGAALTHGLYLASAAAAVTVNRLGNDPVGIDDLRQYFESRPDF